jgi:hypothetical protein
LLSDSSAIVSVSVDQPAGYHDHTRSDILSNKTQRAQPITKLLGVLFDTVFNHVGTMPNRAQVGVDPLHHVFRTVA